MIDMYHKVNMNYKHNDEAKYYSLESFNKNLNLIPQYQQQILTIDLYYRLHIDYSMVHENKLFYEEDIMMFD